MSVQEAKDKAANWEGEADNQEGANQLLAKTANNVKDEGKKQDPKKYEDWYNGADDYGDWGDKWDNSKNQQQLKASGSYDAESKWAKQYEGMKENISSRVDDEDGWRQLDIDGKLKDPKEYQKLVEEWSANGFDVRAIDMEPEDWDGKNYHSSNIAIRKMSDNVTDPNPEPEPSPEPTPDVEIPEIETPTPSPQPTPSPTPTPTPTPEAPPSYSPPKYGGVTGNPYNSSNKGYYYGTEQQARNESRYNTISDNAANAHAKGLEDITTWQNYAQQRENYRSNIMHELYKNMGLVNPTSTSGGNN